MSPPRYSLLSIIISWEGVSLGSEWAWDPLLMSKANHGPGWLLSALPPLRYSLLSFSSHCRPVALGWLMQWCAGPLPASGIPLCLHVMYHCLIHRFLTATSVCSSLLLRSPHGFLGCLVASSPDSGSFLSRLPHASLALFHKMPH